MSTRKCGRVVCNACSPHRITIPYQYIVQPPFLASGSSPTKSRLNVDSRSTTESALGTDDRDGGMKVRLCNPCVPDPNTLPLQQRDGGWRGYHPYYYVHSGGRPLSYNEEDINSTGRETNTFTRDGDFGRPRPRGISAASGLLLDDRHQQHISAPPFHFYSTVSYRVPYSWTALRSDVLIRKNKNPTLPNAPIRTTGNGQRWPNSQSSSRTGGATPYLSLGQRSQSRGHTS